MRANVAMSSSRTAAPYSEYLSILRATLTSLSSLAVFNSPIRVVVCKSKNSLEVVIDVAFHLFNILKNTRF